jgi:hypothetical protein
MPKPSVQTEFDMGFRPQKEMMRKEVAYELLRQSMPSGYADLLAPFQSHQWNLIRLLAMKHRFDELLQSNPVLAYYLANDPRFMRQAKAKMIEQMTGTPQADLLELLKLPAEKSMVKIIKKICQESATPLQSKTLQICSGDGGRLKKLAHLQQINCGALELVASPAELQPHITPQLLDEVSTDTSNNRSAVALDTFRQTFSMHQDVITDRSFPQIKSLEQLRIYHQEMHVKYEQKNREQADQQVKTAFTPPIAGTANIQPIVSPSDVKDEGRVQHNCVGLHPNYTAEIFAGRLFLYRVFSPERATLSIVKGAGGEWQIGELKATCNKEVSAKTRQAVEDWLSGMRMGI